ncbi:MAG: D-alanyl-D-alanine carboxypeptidase family protein [Aphanocapsa sp. GSE-SYN-MK-11-07L]|jgi:D-alanyl-D-alanine carboxypeptidase|nr:D-alanyl-D-alanine carboxypeptidase family protein [Aphanocapsa sp. GSE-SYN-MK-11-07L]
MKDDIPEARREHSLTAKASAGTRSSIFLGLGTAVIVLAAVSAWVILRWPTSKTAQAPAPTAPTAAPSAVAASPSPDILLGHFAYKEAPQTDLKSITPDGRVKLRAAAAQKFMAMVASAQSAGVVLLPLSGYRSIQDQNYLFFDVKAERGQVTTERAQVSAPPGHSEHHTGYAIDIGDGSQPDTHLKPSFETSAAFRWLAANAAYYSFELSFPAHNQQGVSYEPWHWRYVGNQDSLKTFYKARQAKKPPD